MLIVVSVVLAMLWLTSVVVAVACVVLLSDHSQRAKDATKADVSRIEDYRKED